jgi:type IV pilus assembly protein PilX
MKRILSLPLSQAGSALIVALIFLLLMTLLGTAAMRGSSTQERMAGNSRDWNLAFQAAEAGLREGEQFLLATAVLPAFNDTNGFYGLGAPTSPQWMGGAINDGNGAVTYGTLPGVPMYGGVLDGVTTLPRYYFEELTTIRPPGAETETGTPPPDIAFYRLTAIGFGGAVDDGGVPIASTVLSSVYRSR